MGKKGIVGLGLLLMVSAMVYSQDTIRVLCIGNSFSWDAVEQELAPLCAAGNQPIVIGNLYYGGCSLEQHYHHNNLFFNTSAHLHCRFKFLNYRQL